nr:NAD(P)-dependent oxidoreductase [Acuticoccus mangrovi]
MVTGAFGLIGNRVRTMLEAAGDRVVPIDVVRETEDGLPIVRADVRDIHRLHAVAIAEGPFDAIIHCGALSGPMLARDEPTLIVDINFGGTAALLELARIHEVPRFVVCSSTSAYGPTPAGLPLVPETVPLSPNTVYGATKAALEALLHGYASEHGLSGVALRISFVYGPRRTTDCDIREMILSGLGGRTYRRAAGADFYRQFIHVDDAARALILAAKAETTGARIYTVTGGSRHTMAEIVEMVRAAVPAFEAEIGPGIGAGDTILERFDISAAARDLGYRPSVDLKEGIAAYAAWLSARREGAPAAPRSPR